MITRHVVKVGGSLLVKPDAPDRLRHLLAGKFAGTQVNVIVGGGKLINAMREWDAIHSLDPIAMHWRCVRALRSTYELVGDWLPDSRRVATPAEFAQHISNREADIFLVAIDSFYSPADADALPQDWSTTSDSIAALLAAKLSTPHVCLLKSCEVDPALPIEEACSQGIVDPAFRAASRLLDVQFAKL